jgi:hypothetical protein
VSRIVLKTLREMVRWWCGVSCSMMIQEKGASNEVVVKDNADQPEVQVEKMSGYNERSSLVCK